jgi:hypothetical protein
MRRPEVRKFREGVRVRCKAGGRNVTLREKREARVDDVVVKTRPLRYFAAPC